MKPKTLSVLTVSFTFFMAIVVLFASCGKKDEQVTTQDTTKQQIQNQTQNQTDTKKDSAASNDKKKEEEKKKKEEEEKKKKEEEEKKKKEEEKKKKEEEEKKKETGNVNFAEIWPKKCAKCHGKDGTGKLEGVPNLTEAKTKGKSIDALKKIITNGRQAETEDGEDMPSFKGKLTEEEIDEAAKYVKSL